MRETEVRISGVDTRPAEHIDFEMGGTRPSSPVAVPSSIPDPVLATATPSAEDRGSPMLCDAQLPAARIDAGSGTATPAGPAVIMQDVDDALPPAPTPSSRSFDPAIDPALQ